MTGSEHDRPGEPTGSVAEEAAKLFAALQQRFAGQDHTGGSSDPGQAAGHPPPECQACPWCQALAALRTVRPEVVEHLVAAAGSLAAALRSAFDGSGTQADHHGTPGHGSGEGEAGGPPPDAPRVEHIEVR